MRPDLRAIKGGKGKGNLAATTTTQKTKRELLLLL
jgi:hypothetical protein